MKTCYLFDVDGTLTLPCRKIDSVFKNEFVSWSHDKKVFLVTGSDKDKTILQIGKDLWDKSNIFQCSGNEYWEQGKLQYRRKSIQDKKLFSFLDKQLIHSVYPLKKGRHLEKRPGMINFSFLGRNCSIEERENYYNWDIKSGQRVALKLALEKNFTNYKVHLGGQISVDIYKPGCTKERVVSFLFSCNDFEKIVFFGDRCDPPGNDYEIAKLAGPKLEVVKVNSYIDTWDKIHTMKWNEKINGH